MKPEFSETFVSKDNDPVDAHVIDFNWDELATRLGEAKEEVTERDYADLQMALRRILDWIFETDLNRKDSERYIGRRAIALAWIMNPAIFQDSPSLTSIAKQLGLEKATLSNYTSDASRTFGVRNRGQSHGWNWKKAKEVCPVKAQTAEDILGIIPKPKAPAEARN